MKTILTIALGLVVCTNTMSQVTENLSDNQEIALLSLKGKTESVAQLYSSKPATINAFTGKQLQFIQNKGQLEDYFKVEIPEAGDINYYISASNGAIYFGEDAITYGFLYKDENVLASEHYNLKFEGASSMTDVQTGAQNKGYLNYLAKDWNHTEIYGYQDLQFNNIYDDIDLKYYTSNEQLKYDFEVAPGADPNQIVMSFEGTRSLNINDNGDLEIELQMGVLLDQKPFTYQVIDGKKVEIESAYEFRGRNKVGFALGNYDKSKKLIIDPPTAVWASYLTSADVNANGYILDIAVDNLRQTYVTGHINMQMPVTQNINGANDNNDVYCYKMTDDGTTMIYGTVIHGDATGVNDNEGDVAMGVVVDGAQQPYLAGWTSSTNFPNTDASGPSGNRDIFLLGLNNAGTALTFCTQYGGVANESGYGLALKNNELCITGYTESDGLATGGVYQAARNGGRDAFIAKYNMAGVMQWFSYYGGNTTDWCKDIDISSTGEPVIYGTSNSTDANNIASPAGVYQSTKMLASFNTFVAKLNTNGTARVFGTYLETINGGNNSSAGSIKLNSRDEIFVCGQTDGGNITTLNADQPASGGGNDAVLIALDSLGSSAIFATYIGGTGSEAGKGASDSPSQYHRPTGLDVRDTRVLVTFVTSSPNMDLVNPALQATPNALDVDGQANGNIVQGPPGNETDAYVALFNYTPAYTGGNVYKEFGTYIGGSDVAGVGGSSGIDYPTGGIEFADTSCGYCFAVGIASHSEDFPTFGAGIYKATSTTVSTNPNDQVTISFFCDFDPSVVTISGDAQICDDGVSTAPITINYTGTAATWDVVYAIDGTDQPAITGISNPSVTFNSQPSAGVYSISSATDSDGCPITIDPGTATITTFAGPTGINDTVCPVEQASLSVVDMGGVYQWYDSASGGSLLYTGNPYLTPPVPSGGAVYYVKDSLAVSTGSKTVGFVDDTPNGANPFGPNNVETQNFINFTATANVTLGSVDARYRWTTTNGFVDAKLVDNTVPGQQDTSIAVTGPGGGADATINLGLNFTLIAGHSYTLTLPGNTGAIGWLRYGNWNPGYNLDYGEIVLTGAQAPPVYAGVFNWELTWPLPGGNCRTAVYAVDSCPPCPPAVTIAGLPNPVCTGSTVTFTVTDSTNGGTDPDFEWYVNGVAQGVNNFVYQNAGLSDNDSISVVMTSDTVCADPLTDTASIIISVVTPVAANAGPNDTVCADTYTLAGNNPGTSAGTWIALQGGSSVTSPNTFNSGVTGLGAGLNEFEWRISDGVCPDETDTVIIMRDLPPDPANAGIDDTVCGTTATLAGNNPGTGTGMWSVLSGGSTVTSPAIFNSGVTGLAIGANEFEWRISNGVCPDEADSVIIVNTGSLTVPNAGIDDTLCNATTTNLAGNAVAGGETGTWSVLIGPATVTNPNLENSGVTGLGVGTNSFIWTIGNGVCPDVTDTVNIIVVAALTVPNAGVDDTICATTYTLSGNAVAGGETGTWSVTNGGSTVTSINDPSSGVTAMAVGNNQFVWTISNGVCPDLTDTVDIERVPSVTPANAGINDTICASSTNLNANAAGAGETGIWSILSSAGSITTLTDPNTGVTSLGVGNNRFIWTISNGVCPDETDTVNIAVTPALTIPNAGINDTVCSTGTTLSGNAVAGGETGMWNVLSGGSTVTTPNDPNSAVTGLAVGVNEFEWRISNGVCPDEMDTVIIVRDDNPTTSNAGPNDTVCADVYTLAGNNPVVGTGNWNVFTGGATVTTTTLFNSGVTNLSVGGNSFIWTISNGVCPASTDTVIVVRDDNPDAAIAGADQNLCADNTVLAGNTPGTGTGTWTLLNGTATITNAADPNTTVTAIAIGTADLMWTITNGVCPSTSDTVNINRTGSAAVGVSIIPVSPAAICQGVTETFFAIPVNGGTAPSYEWYVNNVLTQGPSAVDSLSQVFNDGDSIHVVLTSNLGCATGNPATSTAVYIQIDSMPTTASAGIDDTICTTSTTLNANTPTMGTGMWSILVGPATITNVNDPATTVTNINPGTISLLWTVSNGVCPVSTDTVDITSTGSLTLPAAGPDQNLCASTTATLAGNAVAGGETGLWTVIQGGGTVTNPNQENSGVIGLITGTNEFEWSITNGVCPVERDTVIIDVSPALTVPNAGPDDTVCVATYTLGANAVALGETGLWSVASGGSSVTNPNLESSGVTGLSVGQNELVWTISNGGICPALSDTVIITNTGGITTPAAGPDQNLCGVNTSTLAGNAVAGGETGTWTVTQGGSSVVSINDETSGVINLSTGTNEFVWSVSNGVCPDAMDTIIITVDQNPSAAAGADQNLCTDVTTLAATNPAIGTGTWSVISGSVNVITPTDPASSVNAIGIGTNTLVWTVSNGSCPDATDTMDIVRSGVMTTAFAGSDQSGCGLTTATLGAIPAGAGETGTWSVISGGATVTSINLENSGVTGLTSGLNSFVWTISNGVCPNSSDTIDINVTPTVVPDVTIAVDVNPVCEGDLMNFSITNTVNDGGAPTFDWLINGSSTGTSTTTFSPSSLSNGDVVSVNMTSSAACPTPAVVSDSIVAVVQKCECPIFVPNAISPNGDGANDDWQVSGLDCYPIHEVRIYNRYGSLVYRSNDYIKPWDGTRNGQPMPVAVYYYVIDVLPEKGSAFTSYTGIVTLMR